MIPPVAILAKDYKVVDAFYTQPSKAMLKLSVMSHSPKEPHPGALDFDTCVDDLLKYNYGETFKEMIQEGTVPMNSWVLVWL